MEKPDLSGGGWHVYLSGESCRLAYGPANATVILTLSLASVNPDLAHKKLATFYTLYHGTLKQVGTYKFGSVQFSLTLS